MANAITQWINSKSDQSNVATNSEILKNSKMIEQDLTKILYAIVPIVEALNETEYETSGKINETLNKIGYLVEFVAATTANSLDELKQEEQEQNEKIVGLLSYEDQGAGALVTAEPTTETKPLMISNESINALAEVISPAQDKMTEAITNMGNNVQQITNQTTEIIKNEREAKIDSLVKRTEKPKELAKPEKAKAGGPDFSGFFNGVKGMLKKFLSPVAWIAAFIAEILPWVLIFGAMFIGFWKTASTKVKAYAIGIFAAILLSWRVLTGKIFKDVKLLLTFGEKLWKGAVWLSKKLHLKEHAVKLKNLMLEKAHIIKEWVLKKAIALKEFAINKAHIIKEWVLKKAIALKEFAINKAMALKKWTLDTIHHAAQMTTTAKENVMNTAVHSSRIGAVLKEMAMSVLEHTSKMFNIAKDFVMSVIRHTADMARIAYALACELAKFIKDMFVTGFKLVKAIALFIADMARVVFQIAMTVMQYLLIAAAVIAIVALVGLIIFGLIKVISMIAPMIADLITTFLSAAWEIIKNIAGTLVEFLAPVGKAVIDFLMALNPVYLIVKLITGIAGAIKDLFSSDEKEDEAEEPVSEEAASALGISADAYNNMEQQKMNLFDSKMNAVLKQIKDLGKVIMLSAAATMVTAKFFGVNPQNGQAAPQGNSMFAQTVATDGSTASESVEKENTSNDYNNVLEQMIKLLQEIRDKKLEVDTKKKKEFFNIF
ncbi:MAG: hypothetical protein ACI4OP_01330 [Candidatus Coprovivens sp.]